MNSKIADGTDSPADSHGKALVARYSLETAARVCSETDGVGGRPTAGLGGNSGKTQ